MIEDESNTPFSSRLIYPIEIIPKTSRKFKNRLKCKFMATKNLIMSHFEISIIFIIISRRYTKFNDSI